MSRFFVAPAFRFFTSLLVAVVVLSFFSSAILLNNKSAFRLSTTHHKIRIANHYLNYNATAGYLTIPDKAGQPVANIFYTAYNLDASRSANRPITFVFNGGPGSASIWLHLGAFGPVKVTANGDGYNQNPYSWLGFTDLVFIDPVGTGYSKPADGVDANRFYGYQADIQSIAGFIHNYLVINHREGSPKFLVGESYGAVRAVGLAAYLQDSLQVKLAGLTLISPALNYRLVTFRAGNDAPYSGYLPTYALTAQNHQLLSPTLQQLTPERLLDKVTAFSKGTYAAFLKSGDHISPQMIDTLHEFTGLDKALIQKMNGRITDTRFTKTLLKDDHEVTGTFDTRITGKDYNADPSEAAIRKLFTKSFQSYVGFELGYQNHLPYLATTAVGDWNYGPEAANGYLDVTSILKRVMQQNPNLRIKVACGYYDLATPAATTDEVFSHLGLRPSLQQNLSVDHYRAGHMIYLTDSANAVFCKKGESFYQQALQAFTRS